jgi:hypothetical protein
VKSDAAEQKATAGFLEFDFPKRAKHWQPRSLTNLDLLSVIGKKFANRVLRKQKFRTGKNGCVKQLRTPFPTTARNRCGWLLGEEGEAGAARRPPLPPCEDRQT